MTRALRDPRAVHVDENDLSRSGARGGVSFDPRSNADSPTQDMKNVFRDVLARIVAVSEELACGECMQAATILADLEADLAAIVGEWSG